MNMGNNTNDGWEWKLSWRRALFDSEIQMADNFLGELSQQQIQPIRRIGAAGRMIKLDTTQQKADMT